MADKRQQLSTHFVIRYIVEKVTVTGVVPYGGDEADPSSIKRDVGELGNATVKTKTLEGAVEQTIKHLQILVE